MIAPSTSSTDHDRFGERVQLYRMQRKASEMQRNQNGWRKRVLLVALLFPESHRAFVPSSSGAHTRAAHRRTQECRSAPLRMSFATNGAELSAEENCVDVVLFGVGDLRTHDHPGLASAIRTKSTRVLPLVILDTQSTLPNIPSAISHTVDTAHLLCSALKSLSESLASRYDLSLHIKTAGGDKNNDDTLKNNLEDVLRMVPTHIQQFRIHVCDLGHVDNTLGYGPFPHLSSFFTADQRKVTIKEWCANLRTEPWEDVNKDAQLFPETFIEYQTRYVANMDAKAVVVEPNGKEDVHGFTLQSLTNVPTATDILHLLCSSLTIDKEQNSDDLQANCNTGLYATHWGGMDSSTFSEEAVRNVVSAYAKGGCSDESLLRSTGFWSGANRKITRNPRSLEHASISWMMTGGVNKGRSAGKDDKTIKLNVKTENLIQGELMTRYLAAPLLFGLVSPRYLWSVADTTAGIAKAKPFFSSWNATRFRKRRDEANVLKQLVEGREWHTLYAAKKLALAASTLVSDAPINNFTGELLYKYWRWHGFLCRYGVAPLTSSDQKEADENDSMSRKEGIVLVHGFGASASQWTKNVRCLAESLSESSITKEVVVREALVPDLLGFGQAEKPALSYTQYLWEAFVTDFIREVVLRHGKCDSFIVGGNSIGGYTSMGVAADDSLHGIEQKPGAIVSASGAPGTGKCTGVILMNSAGPVVTEAEIGKRNKMEQHVSIAEATALDRIGKCSPPSRAVAIAGGNGLLWYLRPRIQSLCKNLYPVNPAAVDDILCGGILRDSLDPGAIHVMVSGSKLPPPRTANELLGANFGSSKKSRSHDDDDSDGTFIILKEGAFEGPVLIAQGMFDPLNDAKTRAIMFENLRDGITVSAINAGHCPHDELPKEMADAVIDWIETIVAVRPGDSVAATKKKTLTRTPYFANVVVA